MRTAALLLLLLLAPGASAGTPLDTWMDATVRVNDGRGNNSTGFLVESRRPDGAREVFLVINKHLIDQEAAPGEEPARLTLFMNATENGDDPKGRAYNVELFFAELPVFRRHPNPSIDILAVDVTTFFQSHPEITTRPIPHEWINGNGTAEAERQPSIGNDVFIVGYPLDMAQAREHAPIVRRGMIANRPEQRPMIDARFPSGRVDQFELRGFLIDAFILPGSSGSPVLLKSGEGLDDLRLIGVVSRTTFTSVRLSIGEMPVLAGIGVVFEAKTVLETLDLF